MSVFGGILSKMFGTGDAAGKVVDNISSGIDKIWYTEEEKSDDRRQATREGNQVYMEWLRSTSGSRVARRFIAVTVTLVWCLQYVASMLVSCIAPWMTDPTTTTALMQTAEALTLNGEQGNAAFMIVLGFYFLGNKADGLFKAAVDKFTKKGLKSDVEKKP